MLISIFFSWNLFIASRKKSFLKYYISVWNLSKKKRKLKVREGDIEEEFVFFFFIFRGDHEEFKKKKKKTLIEKREKRQIRLLLLVIDVAAFLFLTNEGNEIAT